MRKYVLVGLLWVTIATACDIGQKNLAAISGEATQEVKATGTVEPTLTEKSFQLHTIQDALEAFKAAGLEVQSPVPLEVDGHSPLPLTFVEAQRFQMPAANGRTGRIFSFESEGDLQPVRAYYEQFTGTQANSVIVKDNLLLQIGASMPAELANAYRDALESLN